MLSYAWPGIPGPVFGSVCNIALSGGFAAGASINEEREGA